MAFPIIPIAVGGAVLSGIGQFLKRNRRRPSGQGQLGAQENLGGQAPPPPPPSAPLGSNLRGAPSQAERDGARAAVGNTARAAPNVPSITDNTNPTTQPRQDNQLQFTGGSATHDETGGRPPGDLRGQNRPDLSGLAAQLGRDAVESSERRNLRQDAGGIGGVGDTTQDAILKRRKRELLAAQGLSADALDSLKGPTFAKDVT